MYFVFRFNELEDMTLALAKKDKNM